MTLLQIIHYVSEQNKPFKLIPEPIFSQLFDQFKYPTQEWLVSKKGIAHAPVTRV